MKNPKVVSLFVGLLAIAFVLVLSSAKRLGDMGGKQIGGRDTSAVYSGSSGGAVVARSGLDLTRLPLGDGKYSTTGAKKGHIYLCNVMSGGGGAQVQGPWISGTSWDATKKIQVAGSVSWPNARFTISTSADGLSRTFAGNDLPTYHKTGTFPISSTDPAYPYDRNPNSIKANTLSISVPTNPTVLSTPACMRGVVGIALSGVYIFNGFDAQMKDAVANEVQDLCDGHPEKQGNYHYHSLSRCVKDFGTDHSSLVGYAFDGFGIYGKRGVGGVELRTSDLDECHGHTHNTLWDGKTRHIYHYHATSDFPYTVGCFRGKSMEPTPQGVGQGGQQTGRTGPGQGLPPGGGPLPPPSSAIGIGSSSLPWQRP